MKLEFVVYAEALALKELGFDEPCFGYWSNLSVQEPFLLTCEIGTERESCSIRRKNFLCKTPLYQQAFSFFRKKGFVINIYSKGNDGEEWYFLIKKGTISTSDIIYKTYEEAELDCLKKLIEIV